MNFWWKRKQLTQGEIETMVIKARQRAQRAYERINEQLAEMATATDNLNNGGGPGSPDDSAGKVRVF